MSAIDCDIATFHASRRFADVKSGRIAYVEAGTAGRRRSLSTACPSTAITGAMSSIVCGIGGAALPST